MELGTGQAEPAGLGTFAGSPSVSPRMCWREGAERFPKDPSEQFGNSSVQAWGRGKIL